MKLRLLSSSTAIWAVLLAAPLTAQLPEHAAVVGTFSATGQPYIVKGPGSPGLFFVDLPTPVRPVGTPLAVSNLPPRLTSTGFMDGVYSVRHRPSDGRLIVGGGGANGSTVDVHVLTLNGTTVTNVQTVVAGTTAPAAFSAVIGLALFPNGRVLVGGSATSTFSGGPLATSPVGILDTSGPNPTLTPVPLSSPLLGGHVYGAAVSRDGNTAYVTTQGNNVTPPARLYAIDVQAGSPTYGVATLLFKWPNELVPKLSVDRSGLLHTVGSGATSTVSTVYTIDPGSNPVAVTAVATLNNTVMAGPALEPADGCFVYASGDHVNLYGGGPFPNAVVCRDPQGALTPLVSEPMGGWGVPFAIDINRSIEWYGQASPGADSYRFVEFPNPGSVPQLGNLGFSLTVESSGPPAAVNAALVGATKLNVPVLGINLLVGVPQVAVPLSFSPVPPFRATLPLSLPLGLPAGVSLYVQSVHIGAGGLASSDGTEITIF